jgi:hypothetical protein
LFKTFFILIHIQWIMLKMHTETLYVFMSGVSMVTQLINWNVLANFRKTLWYKMSWKSVHWFSSCCTRRDG